jgi:hypothetical protein
MLIMMFCLKAYGGITYSFFYKGRETAKVKPTLGIVTDVHSAPPIVNPPSTKTLKGQVTIGSLFISLDGSCDRLMAMVPKNEQGKAVPAHSVSSITLNKGAVDLGALKVIERFFPEVEEIHFGFEGFSDSKGLRDQDLQPLLTLKNLKIIKVFGKEHRLTNVSLKLFSRLNLKVLHLEGQSLFTDLGLAYLAGLNGLSDEEASSALSSSLICLTLKGANVKFSNKGLDVLFTYFLNLEELSIYGPRSLFDNGGLKKVLNLKGLKKLSLLGHHDMFSNAPSLQVLSDHPTLEILSLAGTFDLGEEVSSVSWILYGDDSNYYEVLDIYDLHLLYPSNDKGICQKIANRRYYNSDYVSDSF